MMQTALILPTDTTTQFRTGFDGVAFSPDGRTLAGGSDDDTVHLWDVVTGNLRYVLKGHKDGVHGVSFSPDGRLLASGGGDHTIRLWDAAAGTLHHILKGQRVVHSVAFSPDGQILARGGYDGTVLVWHPTKSRTVSRKEPASPPGTTTHNPQEDE